MTRISSVLLSCCLVLGLAGCAAKVSTRARVARKTVFATAQAGLTPQERSFRDKNCFMGCPVLSAEFAFGPTQMVYRDGYVLEHTPLEKIPLWVSEQVTKQQLGGDLPRNNKFAPDPKLKPGRRSELADYKGSGYDRGHMAPAGNQTRDAELKVQTFFLSNMTPQVPALNQQIWRELEDKTRDWVEQFGVTHQITGALFYDPKEESPETADGLIEYNVIGKGHVAVPTHLFKIIIAKDSGGQTRAIAFVIENRKHTRPFQFEQFIRSIDWIEERTGLDFMPEMDLQEQRRLERDPSPLWP